MTSVPLYKCPCYMCILGKQPYTRKTILGHCKQNLDYLVHLKATGAHQNLMKDAKDCHDRTIELLNNTLEDSQSSGQSGSPYPDGEQLL
jgi:hypothetical protein